MGTSSTTKRASSKRTDASTSTSAPTQALTEQEARRQARKLRNKAAAQASRDRKKELLQQLEAENQSLRDEVDQLRRRVADLEDQLGQGGAEGSEADTKSGRESYTRHDEEQAESEVAESSSEDDLAPKLEDPVPPAPNEPANGFAPPLERRRSSGGGFQRAVAGLTALLSVSPRARLLLQVGPS